MILSYKYSTFRVPLWLLRCLKRRMRWVRAAGGVVTDSEGSMLLIRRNNRWDLPKGKVEPGETLLQAALREVEEETGISGLTPAPSPKGEGGRYLSKPLPSPLGEGQGVRLLKTYHIFNLYGGWHLKQTSWFPLRVEGVRPAGKPQAEEGITAVEWVSPDEWHRRLEGSYGTLRTLSRLWTR